jgi:hypothetical protein
MQTFLVCKCKSLKTNFRQDDAVNQPTQFYSFPVCVHISCRGSPKETNHLGDLDININIYLKNRIPDLDWIDVIEDMDQCRLL